MNSVILGRFVLHTAGSETSRTYVFVGLYAGLHQVHPFCVDLDQGQDISVPNGLVQNLQPGRVVGTEPPGEAFLCVFGSDVVLPRLPENKTRSGVSPDQ